MVLCFFGPDEALSVTYCVMASGYGLHHIECHRFLASILEVERGDGKFYIRRCRRLKRRKAELIYC